MIILNIYRLSVKTSKNMEKCKKEHNVTSVNVFLWPKPPKYSVYYKVKARKAANSYI